MRVIDTFIENKPIMYKQGMNDLLAMLIIYFYPFYTTSPTRVYSRDKFDLWLTDPSKYVDQIYTFFHDENELICDLYYAFYNIKSTLRKITLLQKLDQEFGLIPQK